MGRGRRDVSKTRRVLLKILAGVLFKQIEFEEDVPFRSIAWIKSKYIDETVTLKLNAQGLYLMNEEQLNLNLSSKPRLMDQHSYQQARKADRHLPGSNRRRRRPRSLV